MHCIHSDERACMLGCPLRLLTDSGPCSENAEGALDATTVQYCPETVSEVIMEDADADACMVGALAGLHDYAYRDISHMITMNQNVIVFGATRLALLMLFQKRMGMMLCCMILLYTYYKPGYIYSFLVGDFNVLIREGWCMHCIVSSEHVVYSSRKTKCIFQAFPNGWSRQQEGRAQLQCSGHQGQT